MKPEHLSPYLKHLIETTESPALRRQFLASPDEKILSPYDTADPLAEERFSVTPFLIHRYPEKVLWLTTQRCAAVCRYCLRKHRLDETTVPGASGIEAACGYLRARPDVGEMLLSGGDPLMLSDSRLETVLRLFSRVRPLRFRICTRMPVTAPDRITGGLLSLLNGYRVRFSVHINCTDELTEEACAALEAIRRSGFEVLTQTVLLRGVNDSREQLTALFLSFADLDLTPYYLFQGDLAAETAAFRVSIQRGRGLYRQVCRQLRGVPVPAYAVDLPDGGGQVVIEPSRIAAVRGKKIWFRSDSGRLFAYPIE